MTAVTPQAICEPKCIIIINYKTRFLRDHYMKNIHIYYFCQNKQEMEAARFKTLSNHVQ